MFRKKIIKNEEDHQMAMKRLDELMDIDVLTADQEDELDLLAHLIEIYEKSIYPKLPLSPIDAIRFRMDQLGLKQRDLIPYFGSAGKVSEIMSGKRSLTLPMIRSLNKGLKIPYESLVAENPAEYTAGKLSADWESFNIKKILEALGNILFPTQHDKPSFIEKVKKDPEKYFSPFLKGVTDNLAFSGCCRRKVDSSDYNSTLLWLSASYYKANSQELSTNFDMNDMTEIVRVLREISTSFDGPVKAKEYLINNGIHFVIVPHLDKTFLDGATFIAKDGNPAISMTLRYDRLDYFWFTLFHELGHVYHHLFEDTDCCNIFIDEQTPGIKDEKEIAADQFAEKNLVDDGILEEHNLLNNISTAKVTKLARDLNLSPAIIAGRIRYKLNNYKILSNLIGNKGVRALFQ